MTKDAIDANLVELGLSPEQACVYKILVKEGPNRAHKLAILASISRPMAYKVLGQLMKLGLVEEKVGGAGKVSIFSPAHPSKLESLINKRRESYEAAQNALNSISPELVSSFNLFNKRPNVQFFEGDAGLRYVHDDILKAKKDILLFRSYLDVERLEIDKLIEEHKAQRVRAGIKVRAVSSRKIDKEVMEHDKKYGITRKYIPENKFALPAQITIYGDKVAIISYEDPIITTIIENEKIKKSFETLFELIWSQAVMPEAVIGTE